MQTDNWTMPVIGKWANLSADTDYAMIPIMQ